MFKFEVVSVCSEGDIESWEQQWSKSFKLGIRRTECSYYIRFGPQIDFFQEKLYHDIGRGMTNSLLGIE